MDRPLGPNVIPRPLIEGDNFLEENTADRLGDGLRENCANDSSEYSDWVSTFTDEGGGQ